MKWFSLWVFLFILSSFSPDPLWGRTLSVVTTTTDLAAIAEALGGKRVKVRSIAKGAQDPHYVAAKPSYMRLLNRADLLLYVGLQLEIGWLPLLVEGARNPGLVTLNLSQGISVLEVPEGEVTRAQGDIHPEGNPHYWLDPRNGFVMARRISQQFKALAPDDGPYFEQRLNLFEEKLRDRIQKWERQMMPFRGQEIVAYHKQWEYLANWLGLSIMGYVEDKPGIPPAPKHVARLTRTIQQRKINALLVSSFINPRIPQSMSNTAGTKMVVLPASVKGEKGVKTYSDLFDSIVSKLVPVLK
ncbi:MAG: metal ABC transporter substrate-binding protein [Candidatus Binatia bacterium]